VLTDTVLTQIVVNAMQKKVFGPGETIIQQGIDWAAAVLAQSGMVLTLNDLSHRRAW